MNIPEQQAMALTGLLYSVILVDATAHGRTIRGGELELLMAATVNLNPASGTELLPEGAQLKQWVQSATTILTGQGTNLRVMQYPQQLLDLCNRLDKNPAAERKLGMLLSSCQPPNSNLLADIYKQIISPLGRRIQVSGHPQHLKSAANAATIRALLLAGIRFGWWWKQTGGRRWHLVFRRQTLIRHLAELEKSI